MDPNSYTTITNRVNGQLVPFLQQQGQVAVDSSQYPIILSQGELQAMGFQDYVLKILTNQARPPSQEAGLSQQNLPHVIRRLDTEFLNSMTSYRLKFIEALHRDGVRLNNLNQQLDRSLDQTNYTKWYTLNGLWFVLVGAIPGYFIGKACDQRRDQANAHKELEIRKEQCVHRKQWLASLGDSEKTRHQQMKGTIKNRMSVLLQDLQRLARDREVDVAKREEISKLFRVVQALFPNEAGDLTVRGTNIRTYLGR